MLARVIGVASLMALVGTTWAANVRAHSLLDTPAPRDQRDGYKDSTPCGVGRASTQPAARYTPGQALDVTWLETVDHSGCFLVELSAQGDQDFQVLGRKSHRDPPSPAYPTSAEPRRWSLPVVLPNVSCEECTLRLRQIMADDNIDENACPPATTPPGSVYTTCANISIGSGGSSGGGGVGNFAGAGVSAGTGAASENDGSACSISARRPTAWLGALLLASTALGSRRGRRARR